MDWLTIALLVLVAPAVAVGFILLERLVFGRGDGRDE